MWHHSLFSEAYKLNLNYCLHESLLLKLVHTATVKRNRLKL